MKGAAVHLSYAELTPEQFEPWRQMCVQEPAEEHGKKVREYYEAEMTRYAIFCVLISVICGCFGFLFGGVLKVIFFGIGTIPALAAAGAITTLKMGHIHNIK